MTNYLNKQFICEHAKSGKCDGKFHDTGGKCGHGELHHLRKFQVGFCDENIVNCSEAKRRGLKNPRQCISPKDMIEEIIDNKMFEI
jgi:hypothetical protein